MLVVHGLLSAEHGVGLWAEDPALPTKSASQSLRTARPHPFAAPLTLTGTSREAILLLPSLVSAPLDSPDLLRDVPRRASKTEPGLAAVAGAGELARTRSRRSDCSPALTRPTCVPGSRCVTWPRSSTLRRISSIGAACCPPSNWRRPVVWRVGGRWCRAPT